MVTRKLKTFAEWAHIASKNDDSFTSDQLKAIGGIYMVFTDKNQWVFNDGSKGPTNMWFFPDGSSGKYRYMDDEERNVWFIPND